MSERIYVSGGPNGFVDSGAGLGAERYTGSGYDEGYTNEAQRPLSAEVAARAAEVAGRVGEVLGQYDAI